MTEEGAPRPHDGRITNRTVTVAGELSTLEPQCFSECDVCFAPSEGCTYPNAVNYDPMATVDDNSCTFDGTESGGCTSDLNGDGSVTTADLLEFLISFGQLCRPRLCAKVEKQKKGEPFFRALPCSTRSGT